MKDVAKMSDRELRVELHILRQQVAASAGLKCPNCDDVGFTVEMSDRLDRYGEHEPEQVQCEFCYTVPDSVFDRRARDEKDKCQHPVHDNPGLVAPCPECGATPWPDKWVSDKKGQATNG